MEKPSPSEWVNGSVLLRFLQNSFSRVNLFDVTADFPLIAVMKFIPKLWTNIVNEKIAKIQYAHAFLNGQFHI